MSLSTHWVSRVHMFANGLSDPTNNSLDSVQLQFLRCISGVHGRTHKLSLLHEFDRLPIVFHMIKSAAKFWNKISDYSDTRLIKTALYSDLDFMIRRHCQRTWAYAFLHTMHVLDLCPSLDTLDTPDKCLALRFDLKELRKRLTARARTYCTPSLPPATLPRCPRTCASDVVTGFTYRFWVGMTAATVAPHLSRHMPPFLRRFLVRLRLSSLGLEVEKGRHARPPLLRPLRHCCTHDTFALARPGYHHNMVEDIRHFLLECPAYNAIRSYPRYLPIFLMSRMDLNASAQLREIFAHPDQRLLAECLSRMWKLRSDILSGSLQWGDVHSLLPQPGSLFTDWWIHKSTDDARLDSF